METTIRSELSELIHRLPDEKLPEAIRFVASLFDFEDEDRLELSENVRNAIERYQSGTSKLFKHEDIVKELFPDGLPESDDDE